MNIFTFYAHYSISLQLSTCGIRTFCGWSVGVSLECSFFELHVIVFVFSVVVFLIGNAFGDSVEGTKTCIVIRIW